MQTFINFDKTGKVYPVEYAEIPKVFFTPHYTGHCFTDMMSVLCNNAFQQLPLFPLLNNNEPPIMQAAYLLAKPPHRNRHAWAHNMFFTYARK
jgi:hypothetical protein